MKFAVTRLGILQPRFQLKPYIWLRSYADRGRRIHYLTVQWLWWQLGAYWRTGR